MGLDLTTDVFGHGQLYVCVRRPESRENIRVLVPPSRIVNGVAHVLNVVFNELIVSQLSMMSYLRNGINVMFRRRRRLFGGQAWNGVIVHELLSCSLLMR